MKAFSWLYKCAKLSNHSNLESTLIVSAKLGCIRTLCSASIRSDTQQIVEYLDRLKNYEKSGVPKNAGTETDDGFDLGRMKRLMSLLGNPQSMYKVLFLALFCVRFFCGY